MRLRRSRSTRRESCSRISTAFSQLLLYSLTRLRRPNEGSVILLPVYEFLRQNPLFLDVLLKDIRPEEGEKASTASPLLLTTLSFASYVLTHATSIATLRSLGYANLTMNVLLNIAEDDKAENVSYLTQCLRDPT